ncbi:helix-turn-helix transcriptional regulator [Streptomyces sp. BH055]|uniref:helix-turn-helix transcriptional regulator n=1 Tax=Streptomyces sp. BH055 TaxID=3401173 RepID=UPI003BB61008
MEDAIEYMRERYGDPLSIAQIAARVMVSRFYFTRMFKDETGTSPGKFLAAIRIHEARRLIETTSMSVTDVSIAVGYNSLGSFTNAFTAGVGVSPGRLRRGLWDGVPRPDRVPAGPGGTVAGTVGLPAGHGNAQVFVGAFDTPVMQHPCRAWSVIDVPAGRPSCYSVRNVPEGQWYLLDVAVAAGAGHDEALRTTLVAGPGRGPVEVTAAGVTSAAVRLRRPLATDPPVLLALPGLEPPRTVRTHPGCASAGADARTAGAAVPLPRPAVAGPTPVLSRT